MNVEQDQLRLLPSIDELLQSAGGQQLISQFSRPMTLRAVRASIALARADIRNGAACPSPEALLDTAEHLLEIEQRPHLQPVINATGVIINTNLGRAPLSEEALQVMQQVAGGYSNLEYDLESGERGSRHTHVAALLRELTGAEAALVTNNNAAAVLVALSALSAGRQVVISRGQLVEIGGGFRVPDVMRQSGCQLVEVGTTNRTRIGDYAGALNEHTALLLRVHPSNFLITGFTESTPLDALVVLARIARHPLMRAVRIDKLTLAALEATLRHYQRDEAETHIPVWRMISTQPKHISSRAASWVSKLQVHGIPARTQRGESTVGGGSLPGETLPTTLLALDIAHVPLPLEELAKRLRLRRTPLIARIHHDTLLLDPRTVLPEQDKEVVRALVEEMGHAG